LRREAQSRRERKLRAASRTNLDASRALYGVPNENRHQTVMYQVTTQQPQQSLSQYRSGRRGQRAL
jgi:hypothetical protein